MNDIKKKFGAITLGTGLLTFTGSILAMDGPGWISAIYVATASLALIGVGYKILDLPNDQEPDEDVIDWEDSDEDYLDKRTIEANRDKIIRMWSHIVF